VLIGIPGAFAIDAWWDRMNETHLRDALVAAAGEEITSNQAELEANLTSARDDVALKGRFLARHAPRVRLEEHVP